MTYSIAEKLLIHQIKTAKDTITLDPRLLEELLEAVSSEAEQEGFDEGYNVGMADCQEHHPPDDRD